MKLFEVMKSEANQNDENQSFNDPSDDKFRQANKSDTRRPRLTLRHLSKLRKMREIRKLELDKRKELFKKIYARQSPA